MVTKDTVVIEPENTLIGRFQKEIQELKEHLVVVLKQEEQPRTPRTDLENELADKGFAKLYRKARIKTQREIDLCLEAHKAGIREVVEWMQRYGRFNRNQEDEYWGYFCIEPEDYEAQLKEWGL